MFEIPKLHHWIIQETHSLEWIKAMVREYLIPCQLQGHSYSLVPWKKCTSDTKTNRLERIN